MVTGRKSAAYLLTGEEDFLKDEFISGLKNRCLDDSNKEFNFTSFSAKDSAIEDMLAVAKTAPFIGKKRLVIIRNVDKLNAKAKETLLLYLKNPTESTCLVLESTKSLSANGFLSAIARYAAVMRAEAPRYGSLDSWIRRRAASLKKGISTDAVQLLKELTGGNLGSLSKELEKVASLVEERNQITLGDIEAVVGRSLKEDVFILVNYINSRDASKALSLSKRLLRQGKRAHEIIGLLGWNFRKLLSSTGMNNFDADELKRRLKLLFDADRAIKTGSSRPEFVLDILISELCAT